MHGFTVLFDGGGRWRTLTQVDGMLHPADAEDLWGNPIEPGTPVGSTALYLTGAAVDRLVR